MSYEAFDSLCKERKVKPADVSRETGISTATLSSWKKGRYTPKQDKLQKIADYFGVPLDTFTSGNNRFAIQQNGIIDAFVSRPKSSRSAADDIRKLRNNLKALADSLPPELEGTPVYYQNEEVARLEEVRLCALPCALVLTETAPDHIVRGLVLLVISYTSSPSPA